MPATTATHAQAATRQDNQEAFTHDHPPKIQRKDHPRDPSGEEGQQQLKIMSKIPPLSKKRMAAKLDGTYDKLYGKKRVPTGEATTLDRLIKERGPFSEISGLPLISKGHDRYHWQLFHVLGKGEYPELRLTDENLLLSTPDEQDQWTRFKWLLKNKSEWKKVFELEARLKAAVRGVEPEQE